MADFEIIGEIAKVQLIARGHGIRELAHLNRTYGDTRWRKLKGEVGCSMQTVCLLAAHLCVPQEHGERAMAVVVVCCLISRKSILMYRNTGVNTVAVQSGSWSLR